MIIIKTYIFCQQHHKTREKCNIFRSHQPTACHYKKSNKNTNLKKISYKPG
ncbi:hypothetical protein D083_1456 [Dickeya solani RNS 08.23.3.1.A]|nr:hypothetical protein D083_1456 [Dickeya solani RNS 08.23.3.1.A]